MMSSVHNSCPFWIKIFLSLIRHKTLKQRAGSTPGQPPTAGQTQQPPIKHKAGEKPEKGDKQQKRPQTPFHHRNSVCDDVSMETDASAGQRLALRGQEGGRFSGLRSSDVSTSSKPPQLHSGGGATVGNSGPTEMVGSPQPPPLSPHPCERGEEASDPIKNPSTPHSQHFYPPSAEPCLLPQKGPDDTRLDLTQPFPPAYSEPLEPTPYISAAVNLDDDGSHAPWRFFNLPRRKDAEFPTPSLPGDKLREEASLGAEGIMSATEWVLSSLQIISCIYLKAKYHLSYWGHQVKWQKYISSNSPCHPGKTYSYTPSLTLWIK